MGAVQKFIRRRWKLLLNILTIIALGVLVYAIRGQLVDTYRNLNNVNAWFLLLLLPVQVANYDAQARMYQGLFAIVGNKLSYGKLYLASLELNFVNHVFPSGGVSGISYFGARMRSAEITGGKATLVQLMKLMLLILSFEILLIAGVFFLAIENKANNFVLLATSSITTLLIVGTFAFVLIIGSKRRINATFSYLTKGINRFIHYLRPGTPEVINTERARRAFEELHNNYKIIESRWRELKAPFLWALICNVTEVLAVYVVYLSFGESVNIGAVILAYGVANFAGLVSILPGGVGIYEALMTGVLVAAGVPAGLSLSVTVMYRVLNTLIQVPPGAVLYYHAIHKAPALESKAREGGLDG